MAFLELDSSQFLEPPHSHSLTQIPHIATIPGNLLAKLPSPAQVSLWNIQESTSVAFASYSRLQELAKERFHRLVPAKNQALEDHNIKYSEPAFHNYIKFLQTEKVYFLEEALPEWRHKAMRIDFGGQRHLSFQVSGRESTLQRWWAGVQDAVEKWVEEVEDIEIPDFEETVQEYQLFQGKEIRKHNARNERNRRRKTMLDTDQPELGYRKLVKVDSAA